MHVSLWRKLPRADVRRPAARLPHPHPLGTWHGQSRPEPTRWHVVTPHQASDSTQAPGVPRDAPGSLATGAQGSPPRPACHPSRHPAHQQRAFLHCTGVSVQHPAAPPRDPALDASVPRASRALSRGPPSYGTAVSRAAPDRPWPCLGCAESRAVHTQFGFRLSVSTTVPLGRGRDRHHTAARSGHAPRPVSFHCPSSCPRSCMSGVWGTLLTRLHFLAAHCGGHDHVWLHTDLALCHLRRVTARVQQHVCRFRSVSQPLSPVRSPPSPLPQLRFAFSHRFAQLDPQHTRERWWRRADVLAVSPACPRRLGSYRCPLTPNPRRHLNGTQDN